MPRLSRLILTLCLAAAAAPLLASPVPRMAPAKIHAAIRTAVPADLLGQLRLHLTTLWAAAGCGIDPSGVKCSAQTTTAPHVAVVPADAGCGMAPSGLCTRSH